MISIHGLHFNNLRGDLYGGLTSAVVALPLAMAMGVTSGAGAVAGLYGAIFVGFFAALFGAVTPFCSCSSIPIFLGFLEAGIPLGVAFSFLITSPLINEYLVILMLGFFGWKITALYVLSGMFIGVVSGVILGRMNLDPYLVSDLIEKRIKNEEGET